MNDKILSLLSLATKAGKVVSGEFSVEKAVKSKKAGMVILSSEASDNTKKKFSNMCEFYQVPIYFYGTKEQLGRFTGKEFRASVAILGEDFKGAFEKQFTNMEVTE